jgi:O-antigen ligase
MMPLAFFVTFVLSAFVSLKVPVNRLAARIMPIVIVGAVGLATMLPHIISRFKSAPEASGNTRIELALCAKEMMLDEPWCGVGINNWGIKINPPYEYAELAGRNTNRGEDFKDGVVETVYLLVGAECGIPALMAMLLWFAHYLVLSVSLAKRLAGTPYAAISAGIAGGLVASYVQSCLEWVLRQQMNLILLMMFFALLDHIKANARRLAEQNRETEGAK